MKALRLKAHHFHTKLQYQKLMLGQIKWWLQNGPITKNGVFPVTTLFFWKFYFSLRTSYKELICCSNNPNAYICTFCKRWSFILRCFFPVSILKAILFQMIISRRYNNVAEETSIKRRLRNVVILLLNRRYNCDVITMSFYCC